LDSHTVRVAVAQVDPKIGDKGGNLSRFLEIIGEAARAGSRLVVFPECALTGYCFSSLEEAKPLAEAVPGPSTEQLAKRAGELDVYVVMGLIERCGGEYYNAAAVAGPEGVLGSYRKVHLPYLGVDRFLTPGDRGFNIYGTGVGRLGIGICYDAVFPEASRAMALEGAEVIVLPTNWPEGAWRVPRYVVNTRAFENHVNFVACNRVGVERGFRFMGGSKVVDFSGDTLAEAGSGEELLYAEIDALGAREKRVVMIPGEWEVDRIGDRRPEFYQKLTEAVKRRGRQ